MARTQLLAPVPIPSLPDPQPMATKICQECGLQSDPQGGWAATSGDFYCRNCWMSWRQEADSRRQPADTENTSSKAKGSSTVQLCKDYSAKRPRTCQCGQREGPGCCCDVPSVPPQTSQKTTEAPDEEEQAILEELAQVAHIPYCDAHNHLDYCLLSEISMDYILSLKKWICEWWEAGWCPYGNCCAYAHGVEDQMMRPVLKDEHFLDFAKLHPLAPAPYKEEWRWSSTTIWWSAENGSSGTGYGPYRNYDRKHHKDGGNNSYSYSYNSSFYDKRSEYHGSAAITTSYRNGYNVNAHVDKSDSSYNSNSHSHSNYNNNSNSNNNNNNYSSYYQQQQEPASSCSSTVWSPGSQDSEDSSSSFASGAETPKAPKLQVMIHNCCEEEAIDDAIFLADAGERLYRGCIYITFGCHPHNYKEYNNGFEQKLLQAVKRCKNKVVGWGECGLDYYKNAYALEEPGTKELMVQCFERQARIAAELKLTFVVHTREAEEDTLRVLKSCLPREHRVHIHAFQNSLRFALEVLDHFPNSVIGISGVVTMPNVVETVVDLARNVPLDRMVLETDAPYLSPAPNHIPRVARAVAKLRGCTTEEVLLATNQACHRVYNLPM